MISTRLTQMFGVQHPVMLAGMGGVSYHLLAATVSEAGGVGCLGASTMTTDQMVEEIRAVRRLTDRPFGVDLLTAMPGNLVAQVQQLIDQGASLFVAGLGVPAEAVELCHRNDVLVANMCGKVDHARRAVDAGCDLVVAAGGIFDGRGLAAALALGADGVWVGTRFIATPEARAQAGYKDALLVTAEDGTVVSRAYTGKTCRVVRSDYTRYFDEHPDELKPFPHQALRAIQDGASHLGAPEDAEVDPDREFYPCGQGVGAVGDLVPAAELVRRFVEEAEQVLNRIRPTSGVPT